LPNSPPNRADNTAQRLETLLVNHLPLVGEVLRRTALNSLAHQAQAGSYPAARALGKAMASNPDLEIRKAAGQALSKINAQSSLNGAWEAWCDTSQPELSEILIKLAQPATAPARARVMSLLCLDRLAPLENAGKDLIEPLIQACQDSDSSISERALKAIARLKNPAAVNFLCSLWAQTRLPYLDKIIVQAGYLAQDPSLVRVLTALKLNRIEILIQGKEEVARALIECCSDADIEIASRAKYCLFNLQNSAAVQAICRQWVDTRQPLLEQAIIQAHYLPQNPLRVHLICALKLGRLDIVQKTNADGAVELLAACQDTDPTIRENAEKALLNLEQVDARERLCQLAIEQETSKAAEITLAAGYLPHETGQQALFLFLMRQWSRYDNLDFDQRLMRVIYETASPAVRQRIAREIQASGKTSYLTILAGLDYHSRITSYSSDEVQTLVDMLTSAREWQKLWDLAFELALPWSVKIVRTLTNTNWLPIQTEDQSILEKLKILANSEVALDDPALLKMLPVAIERARLKTPGRINSAAFSPSQPILAIGTGNRHVVWWNYKQARVEQILRQFNHSIGRVAYTKAGTFLCAERSLRQDTCAVYTSQGAEIGLLGSHQGSVTALEPINETFALSSGRDSRTLLWDTSSRTLVAENKFDFWARSVCVSPDRQRAVLLHTHPSLVSLPDLKNQFISTTRADSSQIQISMARCATFSPDSKDVIAGQYNGQVVVYHDILADKLVHKSLASQHTGLVEGLVFLPGRNLLLSAGAEGQVQFRDWPDYSLAGSITCPGQRLTSLQISPDGAFMVTGSSEAELILWDLRVLDIPSLLSQPLAQSKPDHLALINAFIESKQVPLELEWALDFLRILIQRRYRFDIEVDEIPNIQMGEFDILIDDEALKQP
jgi:WD40 repeat protein